MNLFKQKKYHFHLILLPVTALLFMNCPVHENTEEPIEDTPVNIQNLINEQNEILSIDIPIPSFSWLIRPWKEEKLATIDGNACFAEISFVGANKIKITQLVQFPQTQLDRELITWPEAGVITSMSSSIQHHIAAIDDNKTKSHMPLFSRVFDAASPVMLDPREGLVGYGYTLNWDKQSVDTYLYIYNYKNDTMVYESPEEGFTILMRFAMDDQYVLSWQRILNGEKVEYKTVFYNWRTNEITNNDLTEILSRDYISFSVGQYRNIHPERRYLFAQRRDTGQNIKIDWDENFSNVKITPLFHLLPERNSLSDVILSADGTWGTSLVSGEYRGLDNERLYRRAFFHLDNRYPNGISTPVFAEHGEESPAHDNGAFVQHPVHGMCYAQHYYMEENGQENLYLGLFRMDDVLEIISALP